MKTLEEKEDKKYKPLIDSIVDLFNNSAYDCGDYFAIDDDWCEKHCGEHNPNFNENCIIHWVECMNKTTEKAIIKNNN